MTDPQAQVRALDIVTLCDHHIASCGISAACQTCIAVAIEAAQTEARREVWKDAISLCQQAVTEWSSASNPPTDNWRLCEQGQVLVDLLRRRAQETP